jgi:hypothetical protein
MLDQLSQYGYVSFQEHSTVISVVLRTNEVDEAEVSAIARQHGYWIVLELRQGRNTVMVLDVQS